MVPRHPDTVTIRAGPRKAAMAGLAALVLVVAGFGSNLVAHAVDRDAILAKRPPRVLSGFGFFADAPAQKPAEGVVPYTITTPLFSDHAVKYRFVYVPDGGAVRYDPEEALHFPVGAALVKTFAFPADLREADKDVRLVETRVLLRQQDGWHAWAYLWNDAQTEARLAIAGARVPVETVGEDGEPLSIDYAVPNKNQCKGCHDLAGAITPLGPKARNLNGPFDYGGGETNQLAHWSAIGILDGAPEPRDAPRVPDWTDEAAPVDARARAWLDVNCAHCHRSEGPASNSGLFMTWGEHDAVTRGVGKRPVAAGGGTGGREVDIDPGHPDNSILLYRVESTEPGVMMPELGRTLANPKAVDLLRDWITSMD